MTNIVSLFNKQIINFYNEINNLCDNKVISNYKNKINILNKTNPKKIIEIFIENIYIYKKNILNKNIDFLDKLDNEVYNIVKEEWGNITEEGKNNFWKYLEIFIKLSDKYLE